NANRPFPARENYGDIPMYEDGIGMARSFEAEFTGQVETGIGTEAGFFAWVDAAPAEGYRAPRTCGDDSNGSLVSLRPRKNAPVGILTGALGALVIEPLLATQERDDVRVITVENEFFGGNVGVAGLMVGADLQRVLADEPLGHRYLLPDVCLNRGLFLDGLSPDDLPRSVEIIETDGIALRRALELS
ncbi:MAG: NifB/MoaA-like Fe-S oxidoreductase, partial [Verrucomicrobiales bacterium]